MLFFNPRRMFTMRGIDKPHQILIKAGVSAGTATKILGGYNVRLTIEHLEKMCVLLNCTPNDFFEWHDGEQPSIPEKHSLNTLKRTGEPSHMSELIKDFPVDKLPQVEQILRDLKERE